MRRLLLACASVALLGCGGDSTGPAASFEGTWNLQTINGSALPYTAVFVASPLYKLEILSDQVIANADGTFTESAQVRETNGSTVTTSTEGDNGTWVQHGSQIDLTSASDGTVTTATISGSKLAVNAQGVLGVYTRQ